MLCDVTMTSPTPLSNHFPCQPAGNSQLPGILDERSATVTTNIHSKKRTCNHRIQTAESLVCAACGSSVVFRQCNFAVFCSFVVFLTFSFLIFSHCNSVRVSCCIKRLLDLLDLSSCTRISTSSNMCCYVLVS